MSLKNQIVRIAKSHGADLVAVASACVYTDYLVEVTARLKETGAVGRDYMLSGDALSFFEDLADVRRTFPAARSVLLLGVHSLDTNGDYRATRGKMQGKTARTYAYYPVIRQIAERVTDFIKETGHRAVHGQHLPLKHAASRIGLGSYGHNGLLITREFGSYLALRAVITDAELEPDTFEPTDLPCRDCGRCLKACPTGALYAPYKVNPVLCVNPLSRKAGAIPHELHRKMGSWVCGCDICQEVCPMNKDLRPRAPDPRAGFDPANHDSHGTLRGLDRCPDLNCLLRNESNPIMQRNAVIALSNIGTDAALDILRSYRDKAKPGMREYVAEAIVRMAERQERHNKPDPGDA